MAVSKYQWHKLRTLTDSLTVSDPRGLKSIRVQASRYGSRVGCRLIVNAISPTEARVTLASLPGREPRRMGPYAEAIAALPVGGTLEYRFEVIGKLHPAAAAAMRLNKTTGKKFTAAAPNGRLIITRTA